MGRQTAITLEIVSFMLDAEEHLFGEAKRQGWVPRDRTPLEKELTVLIRGDGCREPRRQREATPVWLVFSGKIDAEKERLLGRPPTKKSRAGCGVSRDERDRGSCRPPCRA